MAVRTALQASPSLATCAVILGLSHCAAAVAPAGPELDAARRFAAERLGSPAPAALPFSFVVGGKRSGELLATWERRELREAIDAARLRRTIRYTDPQTRLELRCEAVEYRDFPVVEWTLYMRNLGDRPAPMLEDLRALDLAWERPGETEFLLHHAAGSQANRSDYGPRETPLPPGATARFGGAGGRPTNVDWSYFNLQYGDAGLILAVGWPGQWAAEFTRDTGRGLRLRAGQEVLRASLLPGEEVRSPLVVLQFWQGDYPRSQNLWRRWMMAHSMPKPGGKLPPPQFVASSSRAYEEMIKANEQNQIMHIDRYLEEGLTLDYWWMDAGWYIQEQGWPQVGTWEVDPKRFPKGLRPISDHAHAKGVKILVWFEPERVMPGTWLYEQHPEWLLRSAPAQEDPLAGMRNWSSSEVGGPDPCVSHNASEKACALARIRWEPGALAFHPGPKGEYSVVRWTAPKAGEVAIAATFRGIDEAPTTTDVHVLQDGRALFDGWINLQGQGPRADYAGKVTLSAGGTLDFVVGWGNGAHLCDSTGIEVRLEGPGGRISDAAREFHAEAGPASPWSYGYLKPAPTPDSATFRAYDRAGKPGEHGVRLLDLGNPAARQWLTDHVDRLLTEQGIDLYRQDFNMDPLPFWQAADAPDRQGITENRHVCGYLAYWDELRRRHPDMLIDSCASGGRRNDLETMRRAVPLWRSDYAFEPIGHQCMTYGISLWLPYHGTGTVASSAAPYYGGGFTAVEPYAFWSNAAPSLGSGIDVRVREIDYAALRQLYGQWRELSSFYAGDFYPLTAYTQDEAEWIAWQFNAPERREGAIQAFRRPRSPVAERRFILRDLDPEATYVLRLAGLREARRASGRELMGEGLSVSLAEAPSATVVFYGREDRATPPGDERR